MQSQNIAVIGSGISGLSSAWLLSKKHNVTLFEADDRIGGHTNTVDIVSNGKTVSVDTGFICFNEATYPNLTAMFKHLNVDVHPTDMNFAASLANGAYEYAGGTYTGLIGQPSNIFKPRHWTMMKDILRFFREAPKDLATLNDDESLSQYLKRQKYSEVFINAHLLPMAAAIWSSHLDDMMNYPARAFIQFFNNHGLLQVNGRPKWGTVNGGSRNYVKEILSENSFNVKTGASVENVIRTKNEVTLQFQDGEDQVFDHVVIASHADQALAMLDQPSNEEAALLGCFQYAKNHAVLHRDRTLMPKRRLTWASWNYLDFAEKLGEPDTTNKDLCVTYWMNSLQNLPTKEQIFVTLNPSESIQIDSVDARFDYTHPLFDAAAMNAQKELWSLQGLNRTWFCGAHFGAGFHEDGLQSGLAVAEQLGSVRRPWEVRNESNRIYLPNNGQLLEAAE